MLFCRHEAEDLSSAPSYWCGFRIHYTQIGPVYIPTRECLGKHLRPKTSGSL